MTKTNCYHLLIYIVALLNSDQILQPGIIGSIIVFAVEIGRIILLVRKIVKFEAISELTNVIDKTGLHRCRILHNHICQALQICKRFLQQTHIR